jgi:hypothetical protein
MDKLVAVLTALYDSEIYALLGSYSNGGWTVKLGGQMKGSVAEEKFSNDELDLAAGWLTAKAIIHYPDSAFAKIIRAS